MVVQLEMRVLKVNCFCCFVYHGRELGHPRSAIMHFYDRHMHYIYI